MNQLTTLFHLQMKYLLPAYGWIGLSSETVWGSLCLMRMVASILVENDALTGRCHCEMVSNGKRNNDTIDIKMTTASLEVSRDIVLVQVIKHK